MLVHIFPFFSKNKNAYQTDKTCDIRGTALTIRLGKGGITDARTSQNNTYRSHREYYLMAGDSLVRRSLRQVILLENLFKPRQRRLVVLKYSLRLVS